MRQNLVSLACVLAGGMSLAGCIGPISPGPEFISGSAGLGNITVPVATFQELKFLTVVPQRYDFSCGSAALATLLNYNYGEPRTEEQVFLGMWRDGDRDAIRRVGFSLLDMKRYLAASGITADGFKVTLDQIAKSGVPGIALIDTGGYRHFVVVKGIRNDSVLLGDPSLGLRTVSRREFMKVWNGIYFALTERNDDGRTTFNSADQWAAYPRAPLRDPFLDPLGLAQLYLVAPQITRPLTGDIQ